MLVLLLFVCFLLAGGVVYSDKTLPQSTLPHPHFHCILITTLDQLSHLKVHCMSTSVRTTYYVLIEHFRCISIYICIHMDCLFLQPASLILFWSPGYCWASLPSSLPLWLGLSTRFCIESVRIFYPFQSTDPLMFDMAWLTRDVLIHPWGIIEEINIWVVYRPLNFLYTQFITPHLYRPVFVHRGYSHAGTHIIYVI